MSRRKSSRRSPPATLHAGADANAKDSLGCTPLDLARIELEREQDFRNKHDIKRTEYFRCHGKPCLLVQFEAFENVVELLVPLTAAESEDLHVSTQDLQLSQLEPLPSPPAFHTADASDIESTEAIDSSPVQPLSAATLES